MSNGCPDKTTQIPPKPPANMLLTFCLPSYSSAILSFSLKNDRNRGKSQKNHLAMAAATTLLTFWCFRVVQCARSRAYVPGRKTCRQAQQAQWDWSVYARAHKRLKTWYLALRPVDVPGMGRSCRISTSGHKSPQDYQTHIYSYVCKTNIERNNSWILDWY